MIQISRVNVLHEPLFVIVAVLIIIAGEALFMMHQSVEAINVFVTRNCVAKMPKNT